MFNNINDNNNLFFNSQLDAQSNIVNLAAIRANAQKNPYGIGSNPYVDKTEISSNAIELFQRDCDINKFNKIAMSDAEDLSHFHGLYDFRTNGNGAEKRLVSEKLIKDLNAYIVNPD